MSKEVDDFLAHYGVPGMKWGKRKAEYKSLSKSEKKAQKTKEIEAARLRSAKGENFKNYSKASANVKAAKAALKTAKKSEGPDQIAKKEIGLANAKQVLKQVKQQNQEDYKNGTAAKNGKELVNVILLGQLGQSINIMADQKRLLANS